MQIGSIIDDWKQQGFLHAWVRGLVIFLKVFVAILVIGVLFGIVSLLMSVPAVIAAKIDNSFLTFIVTRVSGIISFIFVVFDVALTYTMVAATGMAIRDRNDVSFGDLFYFFSAPNKGTILLTCGLMILLTGIASICIIPGIILGICFIYTPYILLIQPENKSPMAILKLSFSMVTGNIGLTIGALVDNFLLSLMSTCCFLLFPLTFPAMSKRMADAFVTRYVEMGGR